MVQPPLYSAVRGGANRVWLPAAPSCGSCISLGRSPLRASSFCSKAMALQVLTVFYIWRQIKFILFRSLVNIVDISSAELSNPPSLIRIPEVPHELPRNRYSWATNGHLHGQLNSGSTATQWVTGLHHRTSSGIPAQRIISSSVHLIKIETNRTEGTTRVTRQRAGKGGIGIVGFIREVFDVNGKFQLLDTIRNGSIEYCVCRHSQQI